MGSEDGFREGEHMPGKLKPLDVERETRSGKYAPSALYPLLRYINQMLLAWAIRKFRRFKAHKIRASRFLQKLSQEKAGLFVHWRLGMIGTFA